MHMYFLIGSIWIVVFFPLTSKGKHYLLLQYLGFRSFIESFLNVAFQKVFCRF